MFAWAKNAPPTSLPQGVSFTVDPGQRRYLVLQVYHHWKVKRSANIFVSRFITRNHCQTPTTLVSASSTRKLRRSTKLAFFSCSEDPSPSHQTRQAHSYFLKEVEVANKCFQAVTHGDVNCILPSNTPLHMFGYRTHAHALGSVITGYVYNEKNHK